MGYDDIDVTTPSAGSKDLSDSRWDYNGLRELVITTSKGRQYYLDIFDKPFEFVLLKV